MAFLSQQLTKIITDVEIPEIIFSNISEKILTEEYIENLKKYEFKSLLPADCVIIPEKKEISTIDIQSFSQYQKLLENLQNTPNPIGISIDLINKIYISFE